MIFLHESVIDVMQTLQNVENDPNVWALVLKFDILWYFFSELLVEFVKLLDEPHSFMILDKNTVF